MADLDAETVKLRERLGKGARYDAAAAPAVELGWARRGTAYFARKLNELNDDDLDGATLLPGWSRRRLIAHVGYQARALSRVVEAARTRQDWQDAFEEERLAEENSSTLPARALRNLFFHSEVHLNVEWRDLKDADWDRTVSVANGRKIAVRDTPFIRSKAVWVHAVDLRNHGTFRDFPPELLARFAGELGVSDAAGQQDLAGTVQHRLGRDRNRVGNFSDTAAGIAAPHVFGITQQ